MKKLNITTKSIEDYQHTITEKNRQYLFDKYNDKKVLELSSLAIEHILNLEKNGIYLSPQEYEDLGG